MSLSHSLTDVLTPLSHVPKEKHIHSAKQKGLVCISSQSFPDGRVVKALECRSGEVSACRFKSRHGRFFLWWWWSASVEASMKYKARGSEATKNANAKYKPWGSEVTENARAKHEARGSEANVGASQLIYFIKGLLSYKIIEINSVSAFMNIWIDAMFSCVSSVPWCILKLMMCDSHQLFIENNLGNVDLLDDIVFWARYFNSELAGSSPCKFYGVWLRTSNIKKTSAYIHCAHSVTSTLTLCARLRLCASLHHLHHKKKKKKSPKPGIEPTRKAPIRLSVHRLNHSATVSALKFVLG